MSKPYAFIPARGGSERIPGKNLREVNGGSLVGRTITVARAAGCRPIVVSTDDPDIKREAYAFGADKILKRSPELAGPHSQIEDAIAEWLAHEDTRTPLPDDAVIVLAQPTTPFRRAETIQRCVELARKHGACCTVTRNHRSVGLLDDDTGGGVWWTGPRNAGCRVRSQDSDGCEENGCVYAFTAGHFREHGDRVSQPGCPCVVTDWLEAFEIDTEDDLRAANLLAPMVDHD